MADSPSVILLWEAATGRLKAVHEVQDKRAIGAFAFAPNGSSLAASGLADTQVRVWRIPSFDRVSDLPLIPEKAAPTRYGVPRDSTIVGSLAFSPNGKRVAAGCWDLTAKLWDINRPVLRELGPEHKDIVDLVGFLKCGKVLLSATTAAIRLWDVKSRGLLREQKLRGGQAIWSHALSKSADQLVSLGNKGVLRVWDMKTWNFRQSDLKLKRRVTAFALSSDGSKVAVACNDGKVVVFSTTTFERLEQWKAARSIISVTWAEIDESVACVVSGTKRGIPAVIQLRF